MREIKFRGRNKYNNEWVYGGYYKYQEDVQIIHIQGMNVSQHTEVIPETVGEFTGLKDINEIDIYEGDILEFQEDFGYHTNKGEMYYVAFEYSTFVLKYLSNNQTHGFVKDSQKDWHHSIENLGNEVKIIGNIYEQLN